MLKGKRHKASLGHNHVFNLAENRSVHMDVAATNRTVRTDCQILNFYQKAQKINLPTSEVTQLLFKKNLAP